MDEELLHAIHLRFKELDKDGSGALTKDDFRDLVAAAAGGREGGGEDGGSSAMSTLSFLGVNFAEEPRGETEEEEEDVEGGKPGGMTAGVEA